jgi:hypothetical protein
VRSFSGGSFVRKPARHSGALRSAPGPPIAFMHAAEHRLRSWRSVPPPTAIRSPGLRKTVENDPSMLGDGYGRWGFIDSSL